MKKIKRVFISKDIKRVRSKMKVSSSEARKLLEDNNGSLHLAYGNEKKSGSGFIVQIGNHFCNKRKKRIS